MIYDYTYMVFVFMPPTGILIVVKMVFLYVAAIEPMLQCSTEWKSIRIWSDIMVQSNADYL